MIAFVKGELVHADTDHVVIDVGGVGYRVFVTPNTIAQLRREQGLVKVLTSYQVREDAALLYGFATKEERRMFDRLLGVTGIGARTAMALLSHLSVSQLSTAVVTEDITALTKAPGIGKKTAQRIALELRDKIDSSELGLPAETAPIPEGGGPAADAVAALLALGYNGTEASRAVGMVRDKGETVQDLIRLALGAINEGRR